MKRRFLISILLCVVVTIINGCLDPYYPPATEIDVGYLVVEGNFNANTTTTILVSRTTPISDDSTISVGVNATVQIESDDGTVFNLTGATGVYTLGPVAIDSTHTFRLKITTANNKSYASAFVSYKQTPAIDTIDYTVEGNDLQIYLSTHDDEANSRYYLWKYIETWAYQSRYPSEFVFANGVITPRHDRTDILYCWKTVNSSQILIGSSAKLASDVIHDFPLHKLEVNGEEFQKRYSILVEQYALTGEAYAYWQQLKKSTESIGTLFDPQPSQITSNIYGVTEPGVPVVGYFSAGSVKQKRIFITKDELPDVFRHTFYDNCLITLLPIGDVPLFDGYNLIFTADYDRGGHITGYETSTPQCVDCRIHGGTTVKPDFW